jgi:hypothetical protein
VVATREPAAKKKVAAAPAPAAPKAVAAAPKAVAAAGEDGESPKAQGRWGILKKRR